MGHGLNQIVPGTAGNSAPVQKRGPTLEELRKQADKAAKARAARKQRKRKMRA